MAPENYDPFSILVPTDSRLPNSGQTITGLYDLNPGKRGQVSNYRAFAKDLGEAPLVIYSAIDLGINARLAGTVVRLQLAAADANLEGRLFKVGAQLNF